MAELLRVGLNTLVIYVMALLGFRLMGQRSVGRMFHRPASVCDTFALSASKPLGSPAFSVIFKGR